jgi:Lipase (class 3)
MKRTRGSSKTKSGAGKSTKPRPKDVGRQKVSGSSDGSPLLVSVQSRLSNTFNPKAAILYGQFVKAAYSMYDPATLTPLPSADFPAGYELTAWVNMRDFILGSTDPVFYGFIAQSMTDATQFVLTIRGTSNGVEWWDDFNAAIKTPFKVPGCGSVGAGFARIYETLEVIERPTGAATAPAVAQSLKSIGGFCQQVSALVRRHVAATARTTAGDASGSIEITGHSLGAALATLYTLENALTDKIPNPGLCTFASPFVGDLAFAAAFNRLGLTSWRIVNAPDIVPKLPPEILGFKHVDTLQPYNSSGKVQPSLTCWHALATYLSLIDPTLQPDPDCRLLAASTAAPRRTVVTAPELSVQTPATITNFSVPSGPVAITITVKVERTRD